MEYVESMEIGYRGSVERSDKFRKGNGIVYCEGCGKEFIESNVRRKCPECGSEEFISGELANNIAGYVRLDSMGFLKKHYELQKKKESAVRMNTKRIVLQLLIMDRLVDAKDRRIEAAVSRIIKRKQ